MFDKNRLRAYIMLNGLTNEKVAELMGINNSTFSKKINRGGSFTREEIVKLVKILDIDDPMAVFFAPEIAKTQYQEKEVTPNAEDEGN